MTTYDSATLFTLKYFELLEKHLKVTWNEAGEPICVLDWIPDDSLDELEIDLSLLLTGELWVDAKNCSIAYGKNHVQTIGFGLTPDLSQFIKLGLIYGERVVLWDTIHSRIMAGKNHKSRKSLIARVACELLIHKAVVQRGGLVLLAHPISWSKTAKAIDEELRLDGPAPTASLGLSLAFAAIDEGLPLHPYTLLSENSTTLLNKKVKEVDHELFSSENFYFQQCLTSLLKDQRVAFLEDVSTEVLYDALSEHEKLRQAIRQHFSLRNTGLSPQQMQSENKFLVDDLIKLINDRNTELTNYVAEGVDATAAFIFASIAVITVGQPLLTILASLGVPAVALNTVVRKWFTKPPKNVIIQAFKSLKETKEPSYIYNYPEIESKIPEMKDHLLSIKDYYNDFIRYSWTEERHLLLEKLSPEISKEILSLLSDEEINYIVNNRKYQQDYIGDYLNFISNIDIEIYWEHLARSFDSEEGFLIYDDDANVASMETLTIPIKLWKKLLCSLSSTYKKEIISGSYNYPLERFPEIVNFQTTSTPDKLEKQEELINFYLEQENDMKLYVGNFLMKAFNEDIPSWFIEETN